MKQIHSLLLIALVLGLPSSLRAWGPHTEITRAALSVLPEDAAIRDVLGTELGAMERYCWMGDYRRGVRPDFFPEDCLLFPASPREIDHNNPAVRNAYEPFFRRAVQAMRTENRKNAARWTGSCIHYIQDVGAPPHAARIGNIHSQLETWLDAKAIGIDGYRPKLLGTDDASALAGMLKRVEGLSDFAIERAEKLRKPIAAMKERVNQPLILECANETARVTADVLLTLGELGRREQKGAVLTGTVAGADQGYLPNVAARVALFDTLYSTCADEGRFEFRGLPAGRYRVAVHRPGNPAWVGEVELSADKPAKLDVKLAPAAAPGNRLRNPDFSLRWVNPKQPDGWRPLTVGYPDKPSPKPGWQSETIAVKQGKRYRVGVAPTGQGSVRTMVRWREGAVFYKNVSDMELADPTGTTVTPPATAKFMQVMLLTDAGDPREVCTGVWCVEE